VHPVALHHIPEVLKLEQQCCENLRSHILEMLVLDLGAVILSYFY